MKATSGELPTGPGWIYEVKWDGMRVIADVAPDGVHAWTSNGRDATVAFPELASLGGALAPVEATLAGEPARCRSSSWCSTCSGSADAKLSSSHGVTGAACSTSSPTTSRRAAASHKCSTTGPPSWRYARNG